MKDAYYFSHDSNATNDPKIMVLISQMGLEGYGIYWILIEHLRDQPGFISSLAILRALAIRNQSSEEKFKAVVGGYGLFEVVDDQFFSLSLNRRMERYLKKSQKNREAANIRHHGHPDGKQLQSGRNANALQTHSERNASKVKYSIVKESKANKSKEKESRVFRPPSIDDLNDFFKEKHAMNPKSLSEDFWNFYESKGWMIGKSKMKNWRAAAARWVKQDTVNVPLSVKLKQQGL